MAYFLKKSNLKKGLYLQIYESFYDPNRKATAHRSYKSLGYAQDYIDNGIDDPVSYFKSEVDLLNQEFRATKNQNKERLICEESPEKYLGYFPLKNINDSLGVENYLNLMQTATDFKFNIFSMISALVYARAIDPCSKSKTFHDVIPKLYDNFDFSLNQLYSGLEYIGLEYEKIIEIYNHQIKQTFSLDTSLTYFDCTNFYFEIDKEDDFRKKGPSKENRRDPIIGLGLLLDANQIPIGMKLYPGNESEKPILRDIIDDLKARNDVTGKTIRVADKGLNCSENILHALKEGDGYIFSKSVKQLPETEKTWVLLQDEYKEVRNSNGDVIYRIKECVDDFPYRYTDANGKKKKVLLTEKRVVTYNLSLAKKKKLEIQKQVEKAKSLTAYKAKKSEYGDSSKYVVFKSTDKNGETTDDRIAIRMNTKAIEKDMELAGYNLLVTSEYKQSSEYIYSAYHNLWRIEESFRIMKSQLDARPVYLQKTDTIIGHFLICYITVLLVRLLQFKVLGNEYSSEDIINFIKKFKVAKISDRKYLNLTKSSVFIKDFASKTKLPVTIYYLTESHIKKMLNHRF